MKKNKLKIVLLGAGNLASHLGKALSALPGYPLVQIYARSKSQARVLGTRFKCAYTSKMEEIDVQADLYILCVSDDQIATVASALCPFILPAAVVAHTSGSIPSGILKSGFSNFGVIYPLQTFTKSKKIIFNTIPFFVTAVNATSVDLLMHTARTLSDKVFIIDDASRLKLHLAAVMVNNFPNFIYDSIFRFLTAHQLDFGVLYPLMEETLAKLKIMPPGSAQTGPAKRHDRSVIDQHLQTLRQSKEKDLYQIYELFSQLIWKHYE